MFIIYNPCVLFKCRPAPEATTAGGIRAAGKIAKEIASPTLKNFKDALPSLQKIKEIMGW